MAKVVANGMPLAMARAMVVVMEMVVVAGYGSVAGKSGKSGVSWLRLR